MPSQFCRNCFSCFLMFVNSSLQTRDPFYRLVSFGLSVSFIFQVFLTIGGDTKFIPLTGVTLPLVSYGGSSVLSSIALFSIVQGIYIMKKDEGEEHAEKQRKPQKQSGEK